MEYKEIDLFEITKRQTVYRYLLTAMYSEFDSFNDDVNKNDALIEINILMRIIRSIEGFRNGEEEEFYDSLQELETMNRIVNFKSRFNQFIEKYFSNYKNIRIINANLNLIDYIERDLKYIGLNYEITNNKIKHNTYHG